MSHEENSIETREIEHCNIQTPYIHSQISKYPRQDESPNSSSFYVEGLHSCMTTQKSLRNTLTKYKISFPTREYN